MSSDDFILVVEDDPDLAVPLCELLQDHNYRVEHVHNGAEALARLKAPDPPGLVLLDLMMPVMDGWEFLAQRKREPGATPVRIVVMSADDSAKARATDADAFVQKPFVTRDLLSTLAVVFEEEKQRQARLRDLRLDQLAALGRMAAGVAHEINNPLTYVSGNLALIAEELAKRQGSDDLRELVRGAIEGADRISRVVGGLKLLVRPPDEATGPVEIGPALDSAISLAENELRHRARVVRDYQPGLAAWGSSARLTQLFLNLILTVAQRVQEGAAADHELRIQARGSGPRLVVEISSVGVLVTAGAERHMLDGLGMSMCRQLVAELGAQLQIDGRGGGGSRLRLILPAATAPAAPAVSPPKLEAPARARLLIVDDEPRIGALLARALGREHDVTALTSAREALARLQAGEDWDVILCDMMMPEMTGMELHAELTARLPAMAERMVFLTGGAFTPRAQAFLEHVSNPRMEKPIDMGRLRQLVRERFLAK